MEIIEYFLSVACHLNIHNNANETAVVAATVAGHADIADKLARSMCDLVAETTQGSPQIIFYTLYNNPYIVTLLLDKCNIDVNCTDEHGFSALMAAAASDNGMLLRLLLKRGANPDARNLDGDSALLLAMAQGAETTPKLLIDNNCAINLASHDGDSPLMICIVKDLFDTAKLLLDHGADVNAVNAQHLTVLHMAVLLKHMQFVELILK